MIPHRRRYFQSLVLTTILFLGLSACNSSLKSDQITFEHECWQKTDSLQFSFQNKGVSKRYSIQLDLVFTEDFKYRNLYVGLISESPSGKKTLNFPLELMDDAGNWYGKISGKTVKHHADLTRSEVFQEEGEYHFRLFHFMQDDLVCGVSNAEFSIREEN